MPTWSKPRRNACALRRSVRSEDSITGLPASAVPQADRVLNNEVLVDPPRRVRAVQGVEVQSPDVIVEQVAALLGRPVDPDPLSRLGVIATAFDRLQEPSREPRTERQ